MTAAAELPADPWEWAARAFEDPRTTWATPGDLAVRLDPRTRQTLALDLIDAALVEAVTTPDSRQVICVSPQEGKSQRASRRFPLWVLTQRPDTRIVIVSYEHNVARRWGRAIRDDIASHPELGLTVRQDLSAQHEWQLAGHDGGVYTTGIGGALTGRPADLLIIDDPVKGRAEADSLTYRDAVWDWWLETGSSRLAPGAPVIVIQTRWHPDDFTGRLLAAEDGHLWSVLSIPAQCEDPAADPLGRGLGEFMTSARGRTTEQWQAIRIRSSARTWAALYQQRPAPSEGAVWRGAWIDGNRGRTGDAIAGQLGDVVVGVDPAATSKTEANETGIVVAGMDAKGTGWVLDDRSLRATPREWALAVWAAALDWGATGIVVEDNQGGEMVVEVLRTAWGEAIRGKPAQLPPPVRRVHAVKAKRVRAESVAALYEAGRVRHAADGTARLERLEDQMLTWSGEGDSPDRVDAMVHALTALFLPQHADAAMAPTSGRWAYGAGRR